MVTFTMARTISRMRRSAPPMPAPPIGRREGNASTSVLPDLGGHLYSCIDKISGAEMLYANPSIKFARIAYRGMWAALGVEFNFRFRTTG